MSEQRYIRLNEMTISGAVMQGRFAYVKGASILFVFKGTANSFEELPTSGNLTNDLYLVNSPTGDIKAYAWNGSQWIDVPIEVSGMNITIKGTPIWIGYNEPNTEVYTQWIKLLPTGEEELLLTISAMSEANVNDTGSVDASIQELGEINNESN